jgi:hypothetical protein
LGTRPFGENERALMRIALSDLPDAEAFSVEAAASYAADRVFEDDGDSWSRLGDDGRRRVLWFAAILRLAENVAAVCGDTGAIHAAWSDHLLHLEIDGVALSGRDVDRVLGRAAALEAIAGRRVLFTSSVCRRGAA